MKSIDQQLKKFSSEELLEIRRLTEKILKREFIGFDLKKLKGLENLFRVRKGRIRIIFRLQKNKDPLVLTIERRKENAYKF